MARGEANARLIAMHANGARPGEIAQALGLTVAAVNMRAFRMGLRFGAAPRRPRAPTAAAPDILPIVRRALAAAPHVQPADTVPGAATVARRAWPVQVAAYVAHVGLGYSQSSVAMMLGRSRRLVSYAANRLEDRRDDPAFDAWIEGLIVEAKAAVASTWGVAA